MNNLQSIINSLTMPGKGILAADESTSTIGKRFASINLENTIENRQAYRDLLATTENLEQYISGVILYDETFNQADLDGIRLINKFKNKGIAIGIKVDEGLVALLPSNTKEQATVGMDTLATRLQHYKEQGADFAKWRNVYTIDTAYGLPSNYSILYNAQCLARYAALCQSYGIVPIVEPEVLMEGTHSIEDCAAVTTKVLLAVFDELRKHEVDLRYIILKPNMVVPGKNHPEKVAPDVIARETLKVLRNCVPSAVPSINFLSGGLSATDATNYLHFLNQADNSAWRLSFSFGRALQADCLNTWAGSNDKITQAKKVLLDVSRANAEVVI